MVMLHISVELKTYVSHTYVYIYIYIYIYHYNYSYNIDIQKCRSYHKEINIQYFINSIEFKICLIVVSWD